MATFHRLAYLSPVLQPKKSENASLLPLQFHISLNLIFDMHSSKNLSLKQTIEAAVFGP